MSVEREVFPSLLGKQTDYSLPVFNSALTQIKSGAFRGLAVTSAKRSAASPDTPTLHEAGINFESTQWFGFLAPAGTPAEVIAKIQADTKRAAADASVKERLISLGGERFRLLVSEGEILDTAELPALEMPYGFFRPDSGLRACMDAWLELGGPHHQVLNPGRRSADWRVFCRLAGIEFTTA